MISKKIEHPLRTIELTYDEMKPFHPREEEMLDRYTSLHNFVKELLEDYNNVQGKFEQHDRNIKQVIARFRAIKTRMAHLGGNAKKVLNTMIPDKTHAETIIEEAQEFKALLVDFNKDVMRLAKESETMHQIFIPLDNKDERLSEIFTEYKDFRGEFEGCADNYSLDLEQYDNDEQSFMSQLNDMAARQTEFISVCNMVIDRFNMLVEEVEKTFEQWEKYNEMVEMMRLMVVTPHDISQICLN